MAEVKAQGRVIEARPGLLVIRQGATPVEHLHDGLKHDAQPGDYVLIHEDGQVEVKGRPETKPDILVPGHPDAPQQDHG